MEKSEDSKVNVVIGQLHSFVRDMAYLKAVEIKTNSSLLNDDVQMAAICTSLNEFLTALDGLPFNSNRIEILYHTSKKLKQL